MLNMIVAMDSKGGIGTDNELPWTLQHDIRLFRHITKGNTVCMGRKTWDSIPELFRPLPDRTNIVLSTKSFLPTEFGSGTVMHNDSIMHVIILAQTQEVWVIGGANVYNQFYGYLDFAVVTHIQDQDYNCDTRLELPDNFMPIWSKDVENILDTKSCIPVNTRHVVYKVTKDEAEPIRRYGRGLVERVKSTLSDY